jgi:hypothetical protein
VTQEALDDGDIFDDDATLLPHAPLAFAEASAADGGAVAGQVDIRKSPAEVSNQNHHAIFPYSAAIVA